VVTPNMDPNIKTFEILREEGEEVVLKTGFGAVIKRSDTVTMPYYESFSVKSPEEMAQFTFEDPKDHRRFYQGGDDQINCVGDIILRNLPDWDQRVDFYKDELVIFGSLLDPYEYLWRIIGTENALCWMVEEPELFNDFVDRIGQFLLNFTEAQIEAGKGRLSGMYIWGDIAYKNEMLFNPATWRAVFKPHVKALIDLCHRNGLMVIYHGCGNATAVFEDMIEIGLDAYHPLEAKAGLDVVELKKTYGSRMAYAGNIDVRILESGDAEAIKKEVLYKIRAGINGGWIFQSDNSVSSDVAPESYKLALDVLRQHGNYPLKI
jgi:uroporphyrinogen decarboxylase